MGDPYRASLDYLYSLQLFGIKLGLDNIRQLLASLGNPQQQLRIIHIAGTNGKGSTAAALANIFAAAGLRAGLYTSPHLHNFTERLRVDTRQISEAEVVALTVELRPLAERLQVTFFEFTTAMALLHFQRSGAEWAILETGLGGRLDATNIVVSELCLLTPISLDHTAYLGSTPAEIAAEKAGIFKPGVPVITSRQPAAVADVFNAEASSLGLELFRAERDFYWQSAAGQLSFQGFGATLGPLQPRLVGEHQQQNLALALAAAAYLRQQGVAISPAALSEGVRRTRWPGRLEWLEDNILLDGAHNAAGAAVLAAYLRQQGLRNLRLLIGVKADKQATEILAALLPYVEQVYATRPPVDVAVPPEKLVQLAQKSGILAAEYADPAAAMKAALADRPGGQTLLVAGSLFLIAAVRELLLPATELLSISD